MGVVSAALRFAGFQFSNESWLHQSGSEWLALLMYVLLILYFIWDSLRIKENK
jgi:hypothetical protein